MGSALTHIRQASLGDVEEIVRIVNAAFAVERFFVDRDRTDVDDVRSRLTTGEFLIGEDEARQPIACVYLERRGNRGYFGLLAVDPARKGRGCGHELMRAVEERFRAEGCLAVDIRVVNLRAELPPIYRRRGYVEVGTEPFEDSRARRPCHFILMSKSLRM